MCGYRSKRLGTTSHSARRLVRVFMITHVKQRRAINIIGESRETKSLFRLLSILIDKVKAV